MNRGVLAAFAAFVACAPAQAATVTIDFSEGGYALDYTDPGNGVMHYSLLGAGSGISIDTFGTIANGIFTTTGGFALHLEGPAQNYRVLSYDARGTAFTFKNDGFNEQIAASADFVTYSVSTHRFGISAADNTENVLVDVDNIVIDLGSSVPEPATWAMMIAGFGLAGAGARRRISIARLA